MKEGGRVGGGGGGGGGGSRSPTPSFSPKEKRRRTYVHTDRDLCFGSKVLEDRIDSSQTFYSGLKIKLSVPSNIQDQFCVRHNVGSTPPHTHTHTHAYARARAGGRPPS